MYYCICYIKFLTTCCLLLLFSCVQIVYAQSTVELQQDVKEIELWLEYYEDDLVDEEEVQTSLDAMKEPLRLPYEEVEREKMEIVDVANNSKKQEAVPLLPVTPTLVNVALTSHMRTAASKHGEMAFQKELAPFYHGVASGDPLPTAVIIWTRITPQFELDEVTVKWAMATDTTFTNIVQTGEFLTSEERDYTVKVDVQNLEPNTTYYYYFSALGKSSLIGRTKTAATGKRDRMRFAVVSCSNYQHGYFNAYGRIAERNDLEAVLHLGDYIYEYGWGNGENDTLRRHEPMHEVINLGDYRLRHGLYKLDENLRRLHQQYAFISVWDDHESANNSWQNGASNHNADEGTWAVRKQLAKQAYFEWMPIREQEDMNNPQRIYRQFSYGDLLDIVMLDTRLEGRDQQVSSEADPAFNDPNRSILGQAQFDWLQQQLTESTAQWKVIGNQVVFSPIETAGVLNELDSWDGYPAERAKIVHYIDSLNINNIVFLTGDVHVGIAADVTITPTTGQYDPENGAGAVAVEMVAASVSSNNLDESNIEDLPLPPDLIGELALAINMHGKFVDLRNHGYIILDLGQNKAQGDWYWVDSKSEPTTGEYQQHSWYTMKGANFLQKTTTAMPSLVNAIPAPQHPPQVVVGVDQQPGQGLAQSLIVLANYPNPVQTVYHLNYALAKPQEVKISLHNIEGKLLDVLVHEHQTSGVYSLDIQATKLRQGMYLCSIKGEDNAVTKKIWVR